MCFSAGASFTAGAVLTAAGVMTVRKARTRSQLFFASIPLIFAAQQLTEGFLWLSLQHSSMAALRQPATVIFLAFAQIVWPFWVPFSIFKFEDKPQRKKALLIFATIGILVSLYLGYCLLTYPVAGSIVAEHILYRQDYPAEFRRYGGYFYLAATIIPPFISSARNMWLVGCSILAAYFVTAVFYEHYMVSVWCFLAAIISVTVYLVLQRAKDSVVS